MCDELAVPVVKRKGEMNMASVLIKDTTREERARIVNEAIGNIEGLCDGCSPGLLRMYDDYINGTKELQEVNMEFNARYVSGQTGPDQSGMSCVEGH